jgi:toxin ParE1/3/4
MHVVWTDSALENIEVIYDYLTEFNPRAASHVATTLRTEGDSLENFPHRGRPVAGTSMRELLSHSYPYIIRYRIAGDTVFILRVRHTSRRPTNP